MLKYLTSIFQKGKEFLQNVHLRFFWSMSCGDWGKKRGDLQISKNQLLEKNHSSVNTLELFVLMICYEIFPALKKYIIHRATPM